MASRRLGGMSPATPSKSEWTILPGSATVLDAVVNSGATMIHGLRFDVKERDQLAAAALQAAVKKAMAKSQAIATGSGRAIDRVIKIEELSAGAPEPMMRQSAMEARANAQTPVAPGELEIHARVRLTVSIK